MAAGRRNRTRLAHAGRTHRGQSASSKPTSAAWPSCADPIVYCFEAVDNGGHAKDIVLARDPKFAVEHRKDLLGGVTVVTGVAADGRKITAVPYYAWDHRAPGEMIVWPHQDGKPADAKADDPTWKDKLYRPLDPASLR